MERLKEEDYFELHEHTTFSPGDGYRQPRLHMQSAVELGRLGTAFTEHGNVSSHPKGEKAATEFGAKAVFGCELYCDTGDARGQLKHHLTVLASNKAGLRNLYRLVSASWENFRYKPTTTGEMLADYNEGLIVLSGCLGGRLATTMLGGKGEEEHAADLRSAARVANRFKDIFGDRYYLEVQPHPLLDKQVAYNQALSRLSRKIDVPLVATGDVHYPSPEDQSIYPLLHAIDRGGRNNTVEAQAQSWEYGLVLAHQSANTILRGLRDTGMSLRDSRWAIDSTVEIASRCQVTLPKLKDLVFPGHLPAPQLFRKLLSEGWRYRGFNILPRDLRREYKRRVKHELDLMERKGFLDYFLVIGDVVRWAKEEGIAVGPARGSAAASLVCYLLRITEINPMHFSNLIFGRFIDENRHDLPDVDLDFDDEKRWRIRDYLVRMYGADRVGNIGTFNMYKGKNSLDDAARVHRIPVWAVDQVKEGLIERSSGDLRAASTIEDSIAMFPKVAKVFEDHPKLRDAQRLEGNLKGFSVHAAGLVVAEEPLTNSLAVYTRETKDKETGQKIRASVLSIDKYDAEYIGALKMDFLGLTNMGLIGRALDMIGMTLEGLYAIPLDDEKVFAGFRRNEVVGIFQFDGRAMRSVNREVKPDNFAEICDINALARPGPLHSGAAADYIMAKHGKKKVERLHPVVTDITEFTQGQIVYQEQIHRTVRELGGFSWEEAANVRKLISKKRGEQAFNRLQGKFLSGSAELGVPHAIALRIWKQLVTAGAYAFCLNENTLVYRGGLGGVPEDGMTAGRNNTITLGELSDLIHKRGDNSTDGCVVCGHVEEWHYVGEKRRLYYAGRCRRCKSWRDQFRLRGLQIYSMDEDGMVRPRHLGDVSPRVMKPMVRVRTEIGKEIFGSPEHPVLTQRGYVAIENLTIDDELVCIGDKPKARQLAPKNSSRNKPFEATVRRRSGDNCEHCGKPDDGVAHTLEFSHVLSLYELKSRADYDHPRNVLHLCNSCHKKFDYGKGERKKRWSLGRETHLEKVELIEGAGVGWVCDVEMEDENHNYVGNGIVSANNAAHCVSYGMLAYWCMWLKQNHPLEFYCAALQKFSKPAHKAKALDILKEATSKGIKILPPHPVRSDIQWSRTKVKGKPALRAGLVQVRGIGDTMAEGMLAYREEWLNTPASAQEKWSWEHWLDMKHFGPGKLKMITEFVSEEDPFGIHTMRKTLAKVRRWLFDNGDQNGLPFPASRSEDVPYEAIRGEHTWVGYVVNRNLKDIYELHRSRTGEELDPEKVKEPEYVNYVVITGEDETGPLVVTVHRWRGFYERYKDMIWDMNPATDLLLVKGYKRSEYRRAIYATELHVLRMGGQG